MQIQISWLLQKPADLDLHCLLRQGMSCSAKERLMRFKVPAGPQKPFHGGSSVAVFVFLNATVVSYRLPLVPRVGGNYFVIVSFHG